MISNSPIIFIVGNSRSGTTMMGRILGNHPDIFTFGELHFFEQLWSPKERDKLITQERAANLLDRLFRIQREGFFASKSSTAYDEDIRNAFSSITEEKLTAVNVFGGFLFYEAARNGKAIPCEQTPKNVFYIKELLELFPKAKIINMIRDPRDVLLSQKMKWKRRFLGAKNIPLKEAFRSWANYHPFTISKLWNSSVSVGNVEDKRVFTLRYENLLEAPAGRAKDICEFIGISFDPKMLEIPQVGSSAGFDSPDKKGINKERAGTWKNGMLDSAELFLSQKVTGRLMEKYGYKESAIMPNPVSLIYYAMTFPLKLSFAFMLNLRRMRNIKETIKRRWR